MGNICIHYGFNCMWHVEIYSKLKPSVICMKSIFQVALYGFMHYITCHVVDAFISSV